MSYTLRQLRYFAAVADCGSISNAARHLNVSQPSISNAILQLEKRYSVVLFLRRNSNGVALTPSGQILLREARLVLHHATDFETLATSILTEVTGVLKIACFVNIAPAYMASIASRFVQFYPGVSIDLKIGNQQEVFDAIDSGEYEIGLTFDLELPSHYRIDFLSEFPPMAVLSESDPLASRETLALSELIKGNFIYLDLPHSRNYFLSLFERQNLNPHRSQAIGSFETVRAFVGNGLGYSILNLKPRNQTNYDGTHVRYVALQGEHRPLRMCCISLKQEVYRRAAIAFIEFVDSFFKNGDTPG